MFSFFVFLFFSVSVFVSLPVSLPSPFFFSSLIVTGLIGSNYLRLVLGDLVTKVVTDKDLHLEIDPRRVNLGEPENELIPGVGIGNGSPKLMPLTETPLGVEEIIEQNRAKYVGKEKKKKKERKK